MRTARSRALCEPRALPVVTFSPPRHARRPHQVNTIRSTMIRVRTSPLWFATSALMVFACTWMGQGGAPVLLRHIAIPAILAASLALFAPRLRHAGPALARALPALIPLLLFMLLVGAGGMSSHGVLFAAMAHDFWHADLLVAPDRRPLLPALACMLPPWPAPYALVWYATFGALFVAAWRHLARRGLPPLARFALLTGSILAYLLIIPGYTEVLTFLVALLCWRTQLSNAEKCVAAALMIGGHEVAGGFAILFLAIDSAPDDRRAWLRVAAFLYTVYVAGYLLAAGPGIGRALDAAARPAAVTALTAPQLVALHPLRALFGIAAAYKAAWLLLPSARRRPAPTRLHAYCVLLPLPLTLIATDTSRIVQFGSLSMLAAASAQWPELPRAAQRALIAAMLLLPSLYVSTNSIPGWGKGLYLLYLFAGKQEGVTLGGLAPEQP
jgi:hypothetical protein